MKNKEQKINKALHQIGKQPLADSDLDLAEQRVWQRVTMKIEEKTDKVEKTSLFNFNFDMRLAVPATVFAVLLLGLVTYSTVFYSPGGNTFVATNVHNKKTATPTSSPTSSPSNSSQPIASNQTNTPPAAVTPKPSPVATGSPDDLQSIALDDNLAQLMVGNANASAGIRDTQKTISRSSFWIPVAKAAELPRYPAVFYGYQAMQNTFINEVNIFTGKDVNIITQNNKWFSSTNSGAVKFNQYKQLLAYSSIDANPHFDSRNIMIYDLNAKKETTLFDKISIYGGHFSWSPDGKYLAVPDSTLSGTNFSKLVIHLYDTDLKQIRDIDLSDQINKYLDVQQFTWSSDSKYLVAYRREDVQPSTYNHEMPCLISIDDGGMQCVEKNNTSGVNKEILLVNNKIISLTDDNPTTYDDSQAPIITSTYGWLGIYDMNSKTFKEYRKDTGDYLYQWIVSKDASKIVFVQETGKMADKTYMLKLKYLNTNTGKVEEMSDVPSALNIVPPHIGSYELIGWNGNEDNVILWNHDKIFWNVNIETKKITKITR